MILRLKESIFAAPDPSGAVFLFCDPCSGQEDGIFPKNRQRILEKLCMETLLAVWYNKKVKTKIRPNVSGFSEKGEYYALYNDPGG